MEGIRDNEPRSNMTRDQNENTSHDSPGELGWPLGNHPASLKDLGVNVLAFLCVAFQVASITNTVIHVSITAYSFGKYSAYISASMGIVAAPLVVINQAKMAPGPTLREANNLIIQDLNRLKAENEILQEKVDAIEEDMNRLEVLNGDFNEIMGDQIGDVQAILKHVYDQKEIIKEMRGVLEGRAMQSIIRLVLECDTSRNFCLGGNDLEKLIVGLTLITELEVDEAVFREEISIQEEWRCGELMQILNEMLLSEGEEEEVIPYHQSMVGENPIFNSSRSLEKIRNNMKERCSVRVIDPKQFLKIASSNPDISIT